MPDSSPLLAALEVVATWPVETAAVAVVGPEGVRAAVGPDDAAFGWASVTKLVTATAVLVAVDEGALGLDDPAGPPGATVRHLLAHASGLPFEGRAPIAAPGARRIYSNTGIEVLAEHVAAVTEIPFLDYLREGVLDPLGMARTQVTGPAHLGHGPIGDLARLALELLRPRLVSATSAAAAREVQFPGLRGVLPGFGVQDPNDWGLGAEIRGQKRPHWTGSRNAPTTFGHFGRSGSFLWVDPVADLALVGLASEPFGEWSVNAWPILADAVLEAARLS